MHRKALRYLEWAGEIGIKRNLEGGGKRRAPAPMMRKSRERWAWRWAAVEPIRDLDGARKDI